MDLLCFQCECQFVNKASLLWNVARSGAFGWYNIFFWKFLQSDVFLFHSISILL